MNNAPDMAMTNLRDVAAHFRALADHGDMLACIKDEARRFVYVNAPFAAYFDTTLDQLRDQTDIDGFPGEPAFAELIEPVLPRRVPVCRHHEITEWVITQHRYCDVAGRRFVAVLARDITLHQQLKAESKQFEAIIRSSSDAIVSKTLDGIVTSWNPAAEAVFGYAAEEMIGRSMHVLLPRERQAEEDDILRRIAAGETVDHFETERLRKDGARINVAVTISPVRSCDGSIIGASKIARNLTDRRLVQLDAQRFAAIVNSSDDAIISKSLEGRILSWNSGAEKIFGYTADEMIGRPMLALFPADRVDEERRILEQILRGESVDHFETVRLGKRGERIDVSVTISPIRDLDGKIVGASKIARDITERKRLQAELDAYRQALESQVAARTVELNVARQRAEAASVAKTAFLANVSHEIRTPMNAILGFAHLLQRDTQSASQSEMLQRIATSGRHLLNVLNDVLDLSKIEAGRLKLEQGNIDISVVADRVHSIMAGRAEAKGLRLRHWVDPRLVRMPLIGDGMRLTQILINFTSNAIKFTASGTVDVRAHIAAESEAGVALHFEVEDTGIGIHADQQQRVFDAFEQADATTTRRFGGTGLGLTISRSLARLMGGDAGVNSELGRGSTFWLDVFLARGDPTALDEPGPPVAGSIRPRARILLVEDNLVNQEVARELLERADLIVRIASNGQEAVELVRTETFDLVLMDMQMPEMDGLEATRRIRRLPGTESLPIIAMTGNAFDEDRRRCLDAGMNDHMAKPVEPALLYAKLSSWIPGGELDPLGSIT